MAPLLVSEILAAKDRARFGKCQIQIENPSTVNKEVRLIRTGCSCYGIYVDDKKLENGQTITLPAGQGVQAEIEFQPADSHSEKSYTADFSTATADGKMETRSVRCQLKVFADIRMTPSVLTVEANPDEGSSLTQNIVIEHCYRGKENDAGIPEFQQLPPEMKVTDVRRAGEPKELAPGLWRQLWQATVHVNFPETMTTVPPARTYRVSMLNEQGEATSGQGTVLVHLRQKIVFPNRVHFGKVPVGKTRSRKIFLTSTEDTLFRIRVNPDELPSNIKIAAGEHSDLRHMVTISITPKQVGPFSEVVKLHTNMYDVSALVIHVEGVAEERPSETSPPAAESTPATMPESDIEGTEEPLPPA